MEKQKARHPEGRGMTRYSFTVPGIPVAKARPRFSRKAGIAYTPKKSADFEQKVALFATQAGVEMIEGPVSISIIAYWPSRKPDRKKNPRQTEWKDTRPDADNILKAVLDGLNGVAYRDDGQVCMEQLYKLRAPQGYPPETQITVMSAPPIKPMDVPDMPRWIVEPCGEEKSLSESHKL